MKAIQEKLKKIISFVKKGFSQTNYEKPGLYPAKDWLYILTFFAAGLLIFAVIAFFVDSGVQNGIFWTAETVDQSAPVYQINQKNLTRVTEYFNQKEANTSEIKNNPKTVPDPSL